MNSKRLPGKVLLPLNGHTVIGEVITRCWRIPEIDLVVVTTPDQAIWDYVGRRQLCPVYQWAGDQNDVLGRYYETAKATAADIIVRITADCPLISPLLCGAVLQKLKDEKAEYASNIEPRTFPQGLDCEAFSMQLLSQAQQVSGRHEREHVTTWMRGLNDVHRVNVASPWPIEGRLTLDTEDDYRTICAYFGHEPYQHLRAA